MSRLYVWETEKMSSNYGYNFITVAVCATDIHEARKKVRDRVDNHNQKKYIWFLINGRPKIIRTGVYVDIT